MYTVYEVITKDGTYIGVTGRSLRTRLVELRCSRGFEGIIRAIAKFANRKDAFALEAKLVSKHWMSLNRAKGGHVGGGVPLYRSNNGSSLRVRIMGVEYSTLTDAGKVLGMKKTAVHYRLNSPYFPDWVYITQPRGDYWQSEFDRKRRTPMVSRALQGRLN
jgi:hypothetical protein